MLNFPVTPKPRIPETPDRLGVYADTVETAGEEWRRGVGGLLLRVPLVAASGEMAVADVGAWRVLLDCYAASRAGHWKEVLGRVARENAEPLHAVEAAEQWVEDFLPPSGSILEKLVRRFQDATGPVASFSALLAAQAATFQLSPFVLLLGFAYWNWRCSGLRAEALENGRQFVDNNRETLTLLLSSHPTLPTQIAEFLQNHAATQLHKL
jgi:hypothetical protein